ncbi:glycosyl transferase, group 1 [Chloroherpeton thalassium ATCC 35110]|uniref:Glycosyl transferase, group 1 n=1 Tax=Chloroherpeton thalassium (strain ATCC 35110 / GB-78) TaxID=517418 RepID=B3QZ90_CHLT3|nr:glycosyl transferase, group 1 [Chloroherpeton thalassium ATCC 35110]
MKNLLIIAYYFPPSGGPGVQRVLKFVKYLREFQVRPVVLTVANGDFPARDESLLHEIPTDVKVYRTFIPEPYTLYRKFTGKPEGTPVDVNTIPKPGEKASLTEQVSEFVRSNFFIPDARIGWHPYAVKKGLEIIESEKIDCIYSSSPPYTCSVIARTLKKKTGLPWIAGFRDPWSGFLSTPVRHGLAKKIDLSLEHDVFQDCDRMEVAWQGIIKNFAAKYPDVNTEKCLHIENGFDEEDIPNLPPPKNQKFTVCYTGSMYGKRSPKQFLDAVKTLVTQGKVDVQKIKLKFIGRFGASILPFFEDETLQSAIEVKSYMPHSESVLELLRSDALLLVVDDAAGSEEIVPGKVFEYIGTSRPTITLALDGAISRLIRETNAGQVANFNKQPEIEAIFLDYYQRFLEQQPLWQGNPNLIKKYTRRESSRKLAELVHLLSE